MTEVTASPVHVPEDVLDDLRARLRATRWFDTVVDRAGIPLGWELGTDLAYLRDLVGEWAASFDWRSVEIGRAHV